MRSVLLVIALAIAVNSVLVLTDSTIDEVLRENRYVLIEFYAPWCGHCKKLQPEYERAAEMIGHQAVIAKVDATVEKLAASKYDLQGYPTLLWIENGVVKEEYDGSRTAEDITIWVLTRVSPSTDL